MATLTKAREPGSEKNIRSTDAKARVILPKAFANTLVDIQQVNDYEVLIRKVETIPAREAWLWRNPKALEAVMTGLQEAKAGELHGGPDITAAIAEFGIEE